jgi:hypothetical protein
MESVLVCILSQTRAHRLTWRHFKTHVLDELEADLALCIAVDESYDYANPFWQHAKFKWTAPEFVDFGDGFAQAQRWLTASSPIEPPEWRDILKVKDQWLGGVKGKEAHPGSGAIVIYFRWLLLHNLVRENILAKYDRIIVTRSDHLWIVPHPPLSILSQEYIWIPDGEHYWGLCDRHLLANSQDLPKMINLIDHIVLRPKSLIAMMSGHRSWNPEQYFALHLATNGLISKVKLFPYTTFMVRDSTDQTRWSLGEFDEERGLIVKYRSELECATEFEKIIKTRHDWEALARNKPELFHPIWPAHRHRDSTTQPAENNRPAVTIWPGIKPYQVLTQQNTVVYLDDGQLKHGIPNSNPGNVFVTRSGKVAYLLYGLDGDFRVLKVAPFVPGLPDRLEFGEAADAEAAFEIALLQGEGELRFTLSKNGVFLCAEQDGRVALSREQGGLSEHFTLIDVDPRA